MITRPMKNILNLGIVLAAGLILTGCFDKSAPNYQYFPNMYAPVGYEAYQKTDAFRNGLEAQIPAEGSVPRGYLPYEYPDSNEGYEAAKADLKNPLDASWTEADMANGKELYGIYCAICHGNKGNGQGWLVQQEKFLGVPSYKDREITEGSIYHVLMYGRNAMGSHANQVNEKERWQIAKYVMQLREDL